MVYQWKIDKYPVSAQVAGETIENLRKELCKDYIEAEDLLEASRAEAAPLHSCFEWDDDKAAEKYRISQARDIINHITVKVVGEKEVSQPVRAFVNISDGTDKGKFTSINVAMENTDYRKSVIQNALQELLNFKNKYIAYSELSKVFEAIDNFADSLNK